MAEEVNAENEVTDNDVTPEEGQSGDNAAGGGDELSKLVAERDHYLEMARRSRADFENYQKRVSRDLQNERRFAMQPLVVDLLPVLDNLDRALSATGDVPDSAKGLVEGIQMVRKQWIDAFAKHGVETIDPTGDSFDPNQHEAVMQQPSPDKPAMTVLQTLQSGYRLHDRIVRPAQVIVAVGGPAQASEPQNEQTEANENDSEDS